MIEMDIKYNNPEERERIINESAGLVFVGEKRINTGNFLVFVKESDLEKYEELQDKPNPVALEEELASLKEQLKATQEALDFLIMKGTM